jgi:hypothetical protein
MARCILFRQLVDFALHYITRRSARMYVQQRRIFDTGYWIARRTLIKLNILSRVRSHAPNLTNISRGLHAHGLSDAHTHTRFGRKIRTIRVGQMRDADNRLIPSAWLTVHVLYTSATNRLNSILTLRRSLCRIN